MPPKGNDIVFFITASRVTVNTWTWSERILVILINHLLTRLQFQYAFLLVSVFALEFLVGGIAYIYETQIDDELLRSLNKTFTGSYGIHPSRTKAIDSMQQNVSTSSSFLLRE